MGDAETNARFVIAVEDINGAWASLQPVRPVNCMTAVAMARRHGRLYSEMA